MGVNRVEGTKDCGPSIRDEKLDMYRAVCIGTIYNGRRLVR